MAIIYFFLNTVGLPAPVTYTSILGLLKIPEFIKHYLKTILTIGIILVVYAVIHNIQGVVRIDYLKSSAFYVLLVLSGFAGYDYISKLRSKVDRVFYTMSLFALGIFVLGVALWLTPYSEWLWTDHKFIGDGESLPRFKGLAHEPSHFALLLSPVALYFFWKTIDELSWRNALLFTAVMVPIGLTISFGFFAALGIALVVTLLLVLLIFRQFKKILIVPVVLGVIGVSSLALFQNPVADRIHQIIEGKDTSVNGRTTEAFMLAHRCAEKGSIWWGIGMGQIKYVGEEVIRPYYQDLDPEGYSKETWPVLRIPNSMAETLAIYGYSGVLLKLGFVIFCFFRFKVYDNYFNLSVYLFIFFYQLMGSFILSSAEVIMWAMAFAKIFSEFDIRR